MSNFSLPMIKNQNILESKKLLLSVTREKNSSKFHINYYLLLDMSSQKLSLGNLELLDPLLNYQSPFKINSSLKSNINNYSKFKESNDKINNIRDKNDSNFNHSSRDKTNSNSQLYKSLFSPKEPEIILQKEDITKGANNPIKYTKNTYKHYQLYESKSEIKPPIQNTENEYLKVRLNTDSGIDYSQIKLSLRDKLIEVQNSLSIYNLFNLIIEKAERQNQISKYEKNYLAHQLEDKNNYTKELEKKLQSSRTSLTERDLVTINEKKIKSVMDKFNINSYVKNSSKDLVKQSTSSSQSVTAKSITINIKFR